jgi:hypothetical protein
MNKGLRIHRLIAACLTAALPCLALADAPSNVALGEVEGIVKYCVKINPGLAKDAQTQLIVFTGRASPGARGSAEYKKGYDLVSDALTKVNRQYALAACASLALPKEHEHGTGGRR